MQRGEAIPVRPISLAEAAALSRARDTDLSALRNDLLDNFRKGPRAMILRGLDPDQLGEAGYAGCLAHIGGWLGKLSPQSPRGEKIARVEYDPADPQARGSGSDSELRAHTDMHDILALGSVRPAATGGESFLVKSDQIFRQIEAEAAQHLPALSAGYYWGTNPSLRSDRPVSLEKVPIFLKGAPDNVMLCCSNSYFLRAAAASRGETLPAALAEALEAMQHIAMRLATRFMLHSGEIAIWHNWSWLHGRTAFANSAICTRLLLRLWLRSDLVPVPQILRERAERIDADHELTSLHGMREQ